MLNRPLPAREKLLEALLSVGMFQLLDDRQPDYASVSATVDAACRWLLDGAAAPTVAAARPLTRLRARR